MTVATVDLELISTKEMLKSGADKIYTPGRIYSAFDPVVGEVKAMFVLTVEAVGINGSPMYPKTGSFTVASDFLCDDNEDGSDVVGEELCLGSWLGGVTTAAAYGFVQIYGFNLVALTHDGTIAAKLTVLPTATDGTWEGVLSDTLMTASTDNPATRAGFAVSALAAIGSVFWDVRQPGC